MLQPEQPRSTDGAEPASTRLASASNPSSAAQASGSKRPFLETFIDGYRAAEASETSNSDRSGDDEDPLDTAWINLYKGHSGFDEPGDQSLKWLRQASYGAASSLWNLLSRQFTGSSSSSSSSSGIKSQQLQGQSQPATKRQKLTEQTPRPLQRVPGYFPFTNSRSMGNSDVPPPPETAFLDPPAYATALKPQTLAGPNPISAALRHQIPEDDSRPIPRQLALLQSDETVDTPTRVPNGAPNGHVPQVSNTILSHTPLLWRPAGLSLEQSGIKGPEASPLAKHALGKQASALFLPDTTPGYKKTQQIIPHRTYGTVFSLGRSNSRAHSTSSQDTESLAERLRNASLGTYKPPPTVVPASLQYNANGESRTSLNPFIARSRRVPSSTTNTLAQLETRGKERGRELAVWQRSKQWNKDDELPSSELSFEERAERYNEIIARHQKVRREVEEFKSLKDLGKKDEPFESLKTTDAKRVEKYWAMHNKRQVLVSEFKIDITVGDIQTLMDARWLNDNVIDFYLNLISERSNGKAFAFSTHFYSTLEGPSGYNGVARWAKRKKIDVSKREYVFVPINRQNTHWCLAVINNAKKRFEFYDSMGGSGRPALELLREYMVSETDRIDPSKHEAHRKLYDSYEIWDRIPSPQQENGYDCGVFTCKIVEVLARNRLANFGQNDMPQIRRKMVYEIVTKQLLP